MSSGYFNRNRNSNTVLIVRTRMAPIWMALSTGAILALLLFVLKVAQVGLAAEWPWVGIFAPLWVPLALFGLVRFMAFLEANKPRGRG